MTGIGRLRFRQTHCEWYAKERATDAAIPYDCETYLALRAAYALGLDAFSEAYRGRIEQSKDTKVRLQADFQRAKEIERDKEVKRPQLG